MKKFLVVCMAIALMISLCAFSCDDESVDFADSESGDNLQQRFLQFLFGGNDEDSDDSYITENTTQSTHAEKIAAKTEMKTAAITEMKTAEKTTAMPGSTHAVETLIDWMKSGTYFMKYTMDVDAGGFPITMKGDMAAQGENVAVTSESNIMGMTVKSRMIVHGSTTYVIEDSMKMIMIPPVDTSNPEYETVDYSKIKKTGSGTGNVKGKTLPYEEYESEGYTIKFYIDGGRVYAIETEGQDVKTLLIIEEESKTVPRGSFDLPKGYTTISL